MLRFPEMKTLSIVVVLALLGAPSAGAAVVPTPDETFVTNGEVRAIARSADTIYLGGEFSRVGPSTGPWVALSPSSGEVDAGMPEVTGGQGRVNAIVPDGSGGYFVGGSFTHVGGVARDNLAHVLADKSVDPGFDPGVSDEVIGATLSGSTLYFGGEFNGPSSVGAATRNHGAAVDATTGAVTAWDPDTSGPIRTLVASGPVVYVGGQFGTVNNGAPRSFLAAVDATTGTVTAWDPGVNGGAVNALALSGTTLYLAGGFTEVNPTTTRRRLAAVSTTTGTATSWDPDVNNPVQAMVLSGSTVYFGGSFDDVNDGTSRRSAAAVDASTGVATDWDPVLLDGTVDALAVSGSTVYLGGSFTHVNGDTQRNRLAAVDATDGLATGWNPHADDRVNALAVSGSAVLAGGEFASVGGKRRNNVAALDAADGSLTPWNPDADDRVNALAVSGSTVYLGGSFLDVNDGASRVRLAAVDATDGVATGWNPSADSSVNALAVSGSTVFVGGDFGGANSINGSVTRNGLAALDATTGAATGWNPDVGDSVYAMALSGSTLYFGGQFEGPGSVGSQERDFAASVDTATGAATDWDPDPDSYVYAVAASGPTVYLGGEFEEVNDAAQERNYAAAFDATTGLATGWDPDLEDYVYALAASGSTVFVGGDFSGPDAINGSQRREHLAQVDATTGVATGWAPDAQAPVRALTPDGGGGVIAGGEFRTLALGAQRGIAWFSEAPANTGAPVVSGTPASGQTVTCSPGAWSGTAPQSLAVEWLRDGAEIGGATSPGFAVSATDEGHALSCRVTASNRRGSGEATSAAVTVLASQPGDAPPPGAPVPGGGPGPGAAPGPGPRGTTTRRPRLRRTGRASARRRGSRVVVRTGLTGICPAGGAACVFRLRSSAGRATVRIAAGARRELRFALGARAARRLGQRGRLRLRLTIVMRAGGGSPVRVRRVIAFA
jgi:trimeric autotransporter adhesin